MSRLAMFLLAFLIALPVGYVGYNVLSSAYLVPRGELQFAIADRENNLALVRSERSDMPRVHDELQAVIDHTLGHDLETVEHQLRSRLNRIGEDIGLLNQSVSTGEEKALASPVRGSLLKKAPDALRDELDFVQLNGFISGDATYAQAIELLARLNAEPWIKRLFHVHLDPKRGGEMFRVTVRLTTLFLPGKAPSQPLPDSAPPLDRDRLAAMASANPFMIPTPVPVAPPPTVITEAPTPRFPYDKWVMTGIVNGPDGAEVWLLDAGSGETRLLTPGEQFSEVTLVSANGDAAEFEIDGRSIHLSVGQSLGDGMRQ